MTGRTRLILIALLTAVAVFAALRYAARRSTADARYHGDLSRRVFDPSRNALADLDIARQQALAQHKNILMDVGGNWCPSCIVLDHALRSDTALQDLLSRNYILLHVNWSSENENKPLLSSYPRAHGYPMLYVLSSTGQLLVAQDTSGFEQAAPIGDGYDHLRLNRFLTKYSPQ